MVDATRKPDDRSEWSTMRSVPAAAFFLISLAFAAVTSAASQTPHTPEPAGFACRGDEKVWVNTRIGVCHLAGERYYGSTKQGKHLCKKAADAEGDRETRNGQ